MRKIEFPAPKTQNKHTAAPAKWLATPVTIGSDTKSVGEWCAFYDIKPRTVYMRRHKGQSWAEAFSPTDTQKTRKSFFTAGSKP